MSVIHRWKSVIYNTVLDFQWPDFTWAEKEFRRTCKDWNYDPKMFEYVGEIQSDISGFFNLWTENRNSPFELKRI